jgi:uncharacterized Tic20 family protein
MAKQTPNHDDSTLAKSKRLNVILWVLIALVTALIGALTVWASKQPDLPSIWGTD